MSKKKGISKAVDAVAAAVRKKFAKDKKAEVGIGLTSLPTVKRWVPSGCPSLDVILGQGVPCGRIIEMYGDESHGKSAVGECILASAQRHGAVPVLIDTEYSLEEGKAERWGLELDKLLPVYPETMEQCFDTIHTVIDTQRSLGKPVVIVWDTLSATPTEKELAAAYGDETPARQARVMSNALKKIYQDIARTETSLIILNQTRQKIGVQFGSKKTTPGGKALRFYASIRLEIRIVSKLKRGDNIIGIETELRTVKNKLAHPLKTCRALIYFKTGLDPAESLISTLKKANVAKAAGNIIRIGGEKFTKKELVEGIESGDEDLLEELKSLFWNAIYE